MADVNSPFTPVPATTNLYQDNVGTTVQGNPNDGGAPVGPGPVTVVDTNGQTSQSQSDGTQVSNGS